MKDASRLPLRVGKLVVGGLTVARRMLPEPVRRAVANRIFYSLFQSTRIMNDNYGWRPGDPESHTSKGPSIRSKT